MPPECFRTGKNRAIRAGRSGCSVRHRHSAGFFGLDIFQRVTLLLRPTHQRPTDIFRTVVDTDCERLSAPLDKPVKRTDDTLGRQRKVHLDPKTLSVEFVQDVEKTECATIFKTVSHAVHRPYQVRFFWKGQLVWLLSFEPLAWLDPQIHLQLSVDAINTFVVPAVTPHLPQVEELKAKATGLPRQRQSGEQLGDPLVLLVKFGAVSVARLADAERPTSECNANPMARHCILGQLPALRWPHYFFREPP